MFIEPYKKSIKLPDKLQAYDQYGGGGSQYQRYRQMSLDDMLLENRIVFLIGEISYARAAEVIMKMLYLDNLKRATEISLYINSPGGTVDDTMAIYDTMQICKFSDRDLLHRQGTVGRRDNSCGRHKRQTLRTSARQDYAASAVGRSNRAGGGYQDSGGGNFKSQSSDKRDFGKAYRSAH